MEADDIRKGPDKTDTHTRSITSTLNKNYLSDGPEGNGLTKEPPLKDTGCQQKARNSNKSSPAAVKTNKTKNKTKNQPRMFLIHSNRIESIKCYYINQWNDLI
ncbi:hypothetical protein KIL84_019355 [Mauremys mutica]|uniref:Uncharacterized protein n=1 Tax=Mauremys mutica TaxID=74926 RepID=A0A9D3XW79_9SAUR|nr:hypothetical protein KIL84_019355 [Mauremys mutica]